MGALVTGTNAGDGYMADAETGIFAGKKAEVCFSMCVWSGAGEKV